jgi:ketosteroid isomerase-like protein
VCAITNVLEVAAWDELPCATRDRAGQLSTWAASDTRVGSTASECWRGFELRLSFVASAMRRCEGNVDGNVDDGATSPTGVESVVVATADEWAKAMVSNDAVRIASFMADDWVIVSESGVSTKEQFMSFVNSGALTHSAMDRVSEARVRVHGDAAVCTARVTNTAHYDGRQFDADEWTTDVFVYQEGRWLCVLSQITAVGQPAAAPRS